MVSYARFRKWWKTVVFTWSERASALAQSRYGLWVLGAVSFLESALPVPIVTDPFLVGYILANRRNALAATVVTLITSVVGGALAYYMVIVALLYVGEWFHTPALDAIVVAADSPMSIIVATLVGAITPIPYTATAWAIALVQGGIGWFILASFVGRGVRYGLVAYATYQVGPMALTMARRHLGIATVVVCVAAVLVVAYKLFV